MLIPDFQPEYETESTDPFCGAVPLTCRSVAKLLRLIISRCQGERLVFDLDSTLLNNRPRNAKIMSEYGVLQHVPKLAEADASHFPDWDARNSMTLTGLSSAHIDRHLGPYQGFWQERFFTSEYCQYDVDVPGAANFVTKVQQAGGSICYLTGRDETMRQGTELSLRKLGFPVPDVGRVTLLMNHSREYSDDLFKEQAMQQLNRGAGILAAFDNEPSHINAYRAEFPKAICVHLFTDHSMREIKLVDGICSIRNFLDNGPPGNPLLV